MSGFHLATPAWLHGVWAVVVFVAILLACERRGSNILERFCSRTMQARLVTRSSRSRRLGRIVLLGVTCMLLLAALTQPRWGATYEATPRAGTELMICLDVSKSMLAEDATPTRLDRAKAEILDLLSYLRGDHVGLVAFAGKATVLCPLTPDFGFLRMVLEEAGPRSVSRGGTNLAAPIQQAVNGFGGAGDVSRAILLITDGEDHDSFPVEAAKKAAERGVKIFTVGFGSEEGSEVMVTDPQSGARQRLTDGNGTPVISRLDGDTLRDIALETEGAYIPAGTGVLDLDSIYRDLLAPLTRGQLDGRGRLVHQDGFQWAILIALIVLVAAVGITSGRARAPHHVLLVVLMAAVCPRAEAVQSPPPSPPAVSPTVPEGEEDPAATTARPEPADIPEDPRTAYNLGRKHLEDGALDDAERILTAARRAAGADGPCRYRATYSLAWVYVKKHDTLLDDNPEEALVALQTAADWFRDAVRLRPEEEAPRHNLEVVLRKALALADSLRDQSDEELAKRIDALIDRQRTFLVHIRALNERAASLDGDSELLRDEYRGLASAERHILSDTAGVVQDAGAEQDSITAKSEEERTPEEQVRSAQLTALLHYLHRSSERLGQTRRQLRQKRSARASRRAATALRELKRARDQLRDPISILTAIMNDANGTLQETARLEASQRASLADTSVEARPALPTWLDNKYVLDAQEDLADRTEELTARLEGGVKHAEDPAAATPEIDPDTQKFLDQITEALPALQLAASAERAAATYLGSEQLGDAVTSQVEGLEALIAAREYFLDIKGLIEVLYAAQVQLQQVLAAPGEAEIEVPLADRIASGLPLQDKDIQRAERLKTMLSDSLAELPAAAEPDPASAPAEPSADQAERQRLEMAVTLTDQALQHMEATRTLLEQTTTLDEEDIPALMEGANAGVDRSIELIEQLRQLFFTLIEHLKETARRQGELYDDTTETAALTAAQETVVAPLAERQERLSAISNQIAAALAEQSTADPQAQQGGGAAPDPEQLRQMQEQFARAAELVYSAAGEMDEASVDLTAVTPEFDAIGTHQRTALEQLVEAIQLLQPPQQQQQQDQQNQQNQQQQQQQQGEEPEEQQDQQAQQNLAQLLQGLRDREAERRAERDQKQSRRYDPVEKDW